MLRKVLLVLSGNAAASILMLLRTVVVARLIPVEDFGIAATFALAMAVVEMMSALGLQQQIVQAREGDDPRFQASLQGFQLLRGLAAGAALVALAAPLAAFLRIEQATWGLMALGVVPVLNALVHFDIHRLQRQHRFGPVVVQSTLPPLASLLAVWPLASWLGDWRVMLGAILVQALLGAVLSHLVAERRFRLGFDRAILAGSLRFGWPILVNGALLFLVFHGDRLVVGRELGLAALAIVSMGMTLTLSPVFVATRSIQTLLLPGLSAALRDGQAAQADRLTRALHESALASGTALVVATSLVLVPLVQPVLGADYAALTVLLPWFAALNAARAAKAGPSTVALAHGLTGLAAWGNVPRVLGVGLAWVALREGHGLPTVFQIAILTEALGHVIAMALLDARERQPIRLLVAPTALALAVAAAAVALPAAGLGTGPAALVLVLLAAAQMALSPGLRTLVRRRRRA